MTRIEYALIASVACVVVLTAVQWVGELPVASSAKATITIVPAKTEYPIMCNGGGKSWAGGWDSDGLPVCRLKDMPK